MPYKRYTRVGLCCKDCQDRHPACHDTCERYKEAKRQHEEKKQIRKDFYKAENEYMSYRAAFYERRKER